MTQEYKTYYTSELGQLEIVGTEAGITAVLFVDEEPESNVSPVVHPCLQACVQQLDEYFKGERQEFSLTLAPQGTPFQQKIWQQISQIPYGQTASYLEIARAINNEKAIRAVGQANGRNPISIIIPCHRIIGSNGKLTGYGGGLWRKAWLLTHEKSIPGTQLNLL